jgi:hypothetical protein
MVVTKTVVQRSNINSAVNIACKFKCYISKSKLVLSECKWSLFHCDSFYSLYVTWNMLWYGMPWCVTLRYVIENVNIPKVILFTTMAITFINPMKLITTRFPPAGGEDMIVRSVWSTIGITPTVIIVTPALWTAKAWERRRRPLFLPAVITKRTLALSFRDEANTRLLRAIAMARLSLPRFWRSRLIDRIMTLLFLVLKLKRIRDRLQAAMNAIRTDLRESLNALMIPLANAFNLRKFARK